MSNRWRHLARGKYIFIVAVYGKVVAGKPWLNIDFYFLQSIHKFWCNDTQHNDIQHNEIQQNNIRHNNIQHNNIQVNDIQHNDNQH